MARRHELRQLYMDGWYERDVDKLMASTAEDFIFDDPAEPQPVSRDGLPAYMDRWFQRVGGHNNWRLTHELREDRDGILTDWEWWELLGTEFQGSALITTSDAGLHLERITYYERKIN